MKTMKSLELINELQRAILPNSSHLYDADSIERKVLARFSLDDTHLKQGPYWTREELEEGLKRARELRPKIRRLILPLRLKYLPNLSQNLPRYATNEIKRKFE